MESAEAAHSAVINTPVAAPVALKKLKAKRMNFDDADNKELMEEAIAGFQHKRGRFWQHRFSQRRYGTHVEAATGIPAATLRKYIGPNATSTSRTMGCQQTHHAFGSGD